MLPQNPTPEEVSRHYCRPVTINDNNCWIWHGYIDYRGYGRYGPYLIHREVWAASGRTLTDGLELCHKCSFKACFNPSHLYEGTHKQNMRDAARDNVMTGPRKLSTENISKIIEMLDEGIPQVEIARMMNISPAWFTKFKKGEFKYANPQGPSVK